MTNTQSDKTKFCLNTNKVMVSREGKQNSKQRQKLAFFAFSFTSFTVLSLSDFSRVLRDSTPRYVGPSVGRSDGRLVPFLGSGPEGDEVL